jgi:hypothetical protein
MRARSLLLCLGLLGCGKVTATVDSGNGSGTADADLRPDADPHGVVTVTVLNTDQSGTPVQGVPVVFFDPDGSMVGKMPSDAKGKASATVLPGANVTVVWPKSATSYQIATIYDIKPGDDLVVGFRNPDSTEVGTLAVTVDPFNNASRYDIYGPCGQADANHVLHFQASCKADTFDVYALAYDSSNALIGWNSKSNVALSSGSTKLDAAGWNFIGQFSAHYSNVPAAVTQITTTHTSGFPSGYAVATSPATPANGTLSLSMQAPGAGTYAWVSSSMQRGNNMGVQQIRQRVAGASTTYGLDVGANLLPWLDIPKVDAATQTVTTTTQDSGSYDTYLVDTQYQRVVNGTTISYEWILLGPTIGNFKYPALPSDVGNVNPQMTDKVGTVIALLIDDDGAGWDSVRAHIFDEFRAVLFGGLASQQVRVSISQSILN